MKTKVSIVRGSRNPQDAEIKGMVQKAIELIGGIDDIISRGIEFLLNRI